MNQRLMLQAKPDTTSTAIARPVLQRKCACGTHRIGGGVCAECGKEKETLQGASLSARGRGMDGDAEVPPIVHEVLRSPGQPLDAATRAFFEPRFGHDFSDVRVHTDARAADSALAVNALAYTVGHDVPAAGSVQKGRSVSTRCCDSNRRG
jgi:hypothetical protein